MRAGTLFTSLALGAAVLGAFGSSGCAALFRDSKPPLHVESDPPGAQVKIQDKAVSAPADIKVPRSGTTEAHPTMPGFEDHRGTARKRVNALWLTADLATCILPVLLC